MTKLRINPSLLLITMFVLAFAGCKKEDEKSTFTLTTPKDLHFNYGQQKSVGFSAQNIARIKDPNTPQGWECRIERSSVVITAPAENDATASLKGEIEVTAVGTDNTELKQVIKIAVKTATELTAPANCHIVTEPDTRYRFDARRKGNEASASISPSDAVIIWTTSKNGISHVSLEEGYIYFATASGEALTEANAVIAAIDSQKKVLWSWHIWAADYDPAAATDELEGLQAMNRNLGAFTTDRSEKEIHRSYGLYYQWGRKDPFVGPNGLYSTTRLTIYNSSSKEAKYIYEKSTPTVGTIEYATANPANFIAGVKESEHDWLFAKRDNSLWGNANSATGVTAEKGRKSLYDPCPAGWMVAPPSIWKSFTTTGKASDDRSEFSVEGEYEYGWTFTSGTTQVYYPAAGRRNFSSTLATDQQNFTNVVNASHGVVGHPVGFYWSNSNSSPSKGALLAFRLDYVNPDSSEHTAANPGGAEGARAGAFPVRCVAE